MNPKVLLIVGLVVMLTGACGDGSDFVVRDEKATQAAPIRSSTAVQPSGFYIVPCQLEEHIQATPRLPYQIEVTDDEYGLLFISGVQVDACMGLSGSEKRVAAEILGEGLQKWLETVYPEGSTETSQVEFEVKVCLEIARLMTVEAALSRISWVSLATWGTFVFFDSSNSARPTPVLDQHGNYIPPSCPIPKIGPTA